MPTSYELDSFAAERRIRSHVRETPLRRSAWLSEKTGADVFFKLDNLQETGAFKLRGAANKLLSFPKDRTPAAVVTASSGNHGLATATMGRKLGIAAEVFMSAQSSPQRVAVVEAAGAQVTRVAGDPLNAEIAARKHAGTSGREYVSPYNDERIIEGQGTIAVEVLRQLPPSTPLDAIFIAVGGGGLVCGIGAHLKRESHATQVVGCWAKNSHALEASLRAGRIVDVEHQPTYSTSTAGGIEPGTITFPIAREVIDRTALVSEEEILHALREFYREEGAIIEGAAGVALASFAKLAGDYAGKTVVVLICGGNPYPELEQKIRESRA
jgi:threonine dehydratase